MFNRDENKPLSAEMAATADLLAKALSRGDPAVAGPIYIRWLRVCATEVAALERQIAQTWAEAHAWRVNRDAALLAAHAEGVLVPFGVLRARQDRRILSRILPDGGSAA